MKPSRRTMLQATTALLASAPTLVRAQAKTRVRYGYEPATNAPLFVAKELGLFDKAGLDVEFIRFNSGPALFPALRSGSIDVADMSTIALGVALSQHLDIKAFDTIYDINPSNMLLVPQKSKIRSAQDLKNRTVGAVKATSAYYGLVVYLQKNGMTLNDIKYIELSPTTVMASFQKGDLDAVYAYSPDSVRLHAAGAVLLTTNAENGARGYEVWVGRGDWLRDQKDAASRLIRAHGQALAIMRSRSGHDQFTKALEQYMGVDAALANNLLKVTPFPTVADMASKTSQYSLISDSVGLYAALKASTEFYARAGFMPAGADIASAIDAGPLQAALQ